MKKPIILFGAGSQSSVIIDIIEQMQEYEIVGLIDSRQELNSVHFGYPIIGRQHDLAALCIKYSVNAGIVGVGDNFLRGQVVKEIQKQIPNFEFINAIHSSTQIGKDVVMGIGNAIMPGVVINVRAQIGDHCIINTNSTVEHDCILRDYSSVAPGGTLAGNVTIGSYSALGVGVNVLNKIAVGAHTVIGSGALVTRDVDDYCLAYGIPAKVVRKREAGERYLK